MKRIAIIFFIFTTSLVSAKKKDEIVHKFSKALAEVSHVEKSELDTGVFDSDFFKVGFMNEYLKGYVDMAVKKVHGFVAPLKTHFNMKMSTDQLHKLVETGVGVFVRGLAFMRASALFREAHFYPEFSSNRKIKNEDQLVIEITRAFSQSMHEAGKAIYMRMRKNRKLPEKKKQEIVKKRANQFVKEVTPKLKTLAYNIAVVFGNKMHAQDAVAAVLKVMQESLKECFHLCVKDAVSSLDQAFKLFGHHKRPKVSEQEMFKLKLRIFRVRTNSTLRADSSLVRPLTNLVGNLTGRGSRSAV